MGSNASKWLRATQIILFTCLLAGCSGSGSGSNVASSGGSGVTNPGGGATDGNDSDQDNNSSQGDDSNQDNGSSNESENYDGTTGNNDQWNVGLTPDSYGNGTFTITNKSTDPPTTYTGTYTVAPSGFTKFTCTGEPACEGYGFMIAENVVALWFTTPKTLPIVAVVQSTCPTTDTPNVHNFVRLPNQEDQVNGWVQTSDGYGKSVMTLGPSISFDITNITFQPVYKAPVTEEGYACTNGTISKVMDTHTVRINMTDSGVMIRNDGVLEGGVLGLKQPASSFANLAGFLATKHFLGIQWNGKTGTVVALKGRYMTPGATETYEDEGFKTQSFHCVVGALGCIFSQSVNPDSGKSSGKPFARTFLSERVDAGTEPPTNYYGLFSVTGTHGNGAIAMNQVGGKYLFFEAARDASNGQGKNDPYNAIILEHVPM